MMRAAGAKLWVRMTSAAVLVGSIASCTQVFDYPDVQRENTAALCRDEVDNDLDGKTDCQDSDCASHCRENSDATCHDGKDNDFDGKKDCEVPSCGPYCVESTNETCHDAKDNDNDGKVDCADPDCASFCPEADAKSCSDGVDNDSDGKTDCDDPDCDGFCPEQSVTACNDGRDNDGDGLPDASDPQCWLLAAPDVRRCASTSGVDLIENFDSPFTSYSQFVYSEWQGFIGSLHDNITHSGGPASSRQDRAVGFQGPVTSGIGGAVRTWQISGSWQDFELSFIATIPSGGLLRAGIVPSELAPIFSTPRPGSETALFAITLDAMHAPPTIALDVSGAHVDAPLPLTRTFCPGGVSFCAEDYGQIRVTLEDDGFVATLTRPNGEHVELHAPPPSSLSMPASRLVFWGGSTGDVGSFDDVRLRVRGENPCGFAAPQIPGASCDFHGDLQAFGQAVSLADDGGRYCALVTASHDGTVPHAETVTAWTSNDGASWSAASSPDSPPFVLPADSLPIGAGIAHDDAGFHVAAAYHDGAEVRVGLTAGKSCGGWGALAPGPTLFPDADAPSYVIVNGKHALYFTRPATDGTNRTLWRIMRGDSEDAWLEPELVSELPVNVGSPVTVQLVGTRDLVLVHPTTQSTGLAGVGVLVADSAGRSWKSVGRTPFLAIPEGVENYSGSLDFDDLGVLSAALSWKKQGGFLLYGALSQLGLNNLKAQVSEVSVGTALLVPAGGTFPEPSPRTKSTCGDGTCDPGEDCDGCSQDCKCGGTTLLSDPFSQSESWQVMSNGSEPYLMAYLGTNPASLNWAGGDNTWSALPLEHPITGDFELSFDLFVPYTDNVAAPSCTAYVGLGTVPDPAASPGSDPTQAGVFAAFTSSSHCVGRYWSAPFVQAGTSTFTMAAEGVEDDVSAGCKQEEIETYEGVEAWRHVVLRRDGNQVSVAIEHDTCGAAARTVEYSGAISELPSLLVGFGGGPYRECPTAAGAGTITNLRLSLRDDPKRCAEGKALCGTGSEQRNCVDTDRSTEHCGGCGHACGGNEVCSAGRCVCSSQEGVLECDGACVDSLTDIENCGTCGHPCKTSCFKGVCEAYPGNCQAPIPLPEEGGQVNLDPTAQSPDLVDICGRTIYDEAVYSWTPSVSGVATVEVVFGTGYLVTELGITADSTCSSSSWAVCSDPNKDDPSVFPVIAGTTYRIAVGVVEGVPSMAEATLSVEVAP